MAFLVATLDPQSDRGANVPRPFTIEEFIVVQWLAPLASESPEIILATLFLLLVRRKEQLRHVLRLFSLALKGTKSPVKKV